MFGSFKNISYLCIVFFIVLDLRLTKVWELSGAPFFMSLPYLNIIIKIPLPLRSDRGMKITKFL